MDELDRFDRLLEVGSGDRLGVARDLADRGRDVIAIDVAVDEGADGDGTTGRPDGSLRVRHGDVVALAEASDPTSEIDASAETDTSVGIDSAAGVDAVYARRLPAELQRPTVELAGRLDAACLFTTLGFEEPVVPVERRSLPRTTLYVARSAADPSPCRG
ncbi:hypothetical protein GCM10008992_21330 [Halorubrum aquaticum]